MSYLCNSMPFGMILKSVGIVKTSIKKPFLFIGESEIISEKIKAIKERMNKIRHESSQIVINNYTQGWSPVDKVFAPEWSQDVHAEFANIKL